MRRFFMPLLAVALAATAHAQDRPALVELRLFDAPTKVAGIGNFVEIVGRELHRCPAPPADPTLKPPPCAHAQVEVKVGGVQVPVLSAGPERILINLIDTVPLGRRKVEVELGGRRVGALDLEVVKEALPAPGGDAPDERDAIRSRFDVVRFDLVRDGAGVRFIIEGKALEVPDGSNVTLTLGYAKRALEAKLVQVTAGTFRATFGPFTRALPLGTWSASALFEIRKQPPRLLRRWAPTQVERDVLDHLERSLPLTLGTAEEIAAQREALRAHYRAVAVETERLLDDVLAAYASGCRVLFRDAARNTYGVAAHAAHVQQVGAARTPQDLARVQADLRFATAGGHLKADDYQAWAEGTLLPAWLVSFGADRDYRESTVVPIDPRAARLAEDLHTIVFGTLRTNAEALFAAARLPTPGSLVTPPGGAQLPPLEGTGQGRRAFERGRDEIVSRAAGP